MLDGKKILITGASGFLGSYLAAECFAQNAHLYGIDISFPSEHSIWKEFSAQKIEASATEDFFKKNSFDLIFHLAGSASVNNSVQFPEDDFSNSLPQTFRLIQLLKKYAPNAHLIFFSSAAVYGNPKFLPVKEDAEINPVSPYGIHKALAESMIKFYSAQYNFRSSIIRIFSAFGEGLRKQIFWDVMNKYQEGLKENKPKIIIDLFGTGNESRDFIHAEDVAKAAVLTALNADKNNFNIYNVAAGNEINIREAIEYLFAEAIMQPEINFTGTIRKGDPERWKADTGKLKSIGFKITKKPEYSLKNYYQWFLSIK